MTPKKKAQKLRKFSDIPEFDKAMRKLINVPNEVVVRKETTPNRKEKPRN